MDRSAQVLLLCFSMASAKTLLGTIDAPDGSISGLAYGNGSLWAVDDISNYMYRVDPGTGDIQSSWHIEPVAGMTLTGCGFGSNSVYVAMDEIWVYFYTVEGIYSGYFSAAC